MRAGEKRSLARLAAGVAVAALMAGMALGQPVASAGAQEETTTTHQIQMVAAKASLTHGLDAKKAKQGDAVQLKLEEPVQVPGSMLLPKGTLLTGRVDAVQPSENKGPSSIEVTLDRAQLKDGKDLAVKISIVRIVPGVSFAAQQQGQAAAPVSAPGSGPSLAPGSGPSPGPRAMPGQAGGAGTNLAESGVSSPAMTAGQPGTGNATGEPSSLSGSMQAQPEVAGVALKSDIHAKDSGTFTAAKRNVHLEGGTELLLAVAVIPAGVEVH